MDNQTDIPQQQISPQPPQIPNNFPWLKVILLIFAISIPLGIGGYILGTQKNQPISQNQQILPSITTIQPSLTPDVTTNWKMYKNNTYGYQIKYPPNWLLDERDNSPIFYPPGVTPGMTEKITSMPFSEPSISIDVLDLPFTGIPQNIKPGMFLFSKALTVDGKQAHFYQKFCAPNCSQNVDIPYNNGDKTVEISIIVNGEENTNLFNQENNTHIQDINGDTLMTILSTFKFTDQNQTVDTASWKTYKDEKYGFEFNYPQNYVITTNFDRGYNAIAYNSNQPCLASFGIKVSTNDLNPEGSFCLVNKFTNNQIGQVNSINFSSEKDIWTVTQNGSPDQVLSVWDRTKSQDEIIKTSGGGSETSSYYYFIPKSSTNNSLIAVFTIPQAYRLRCDLINQASQQSQCKNFYSDVIQKYNGGQTIIDTWLPENYLKTLYVDAETMVKSFNFVSK